MPATPFLPAPFVAAQALAGLFYSSPGHRDPDCNGAQFIVHHLSIGSRWMAAA